MAVFLFEIGLEEVPARMIAGAEAELRRRVVEMLGRQRLLVEGAEPEVQSFATPRRLAVRVGGVAERQADVAEEMMGPSAAIAFKDGVAGPAAMAFAKKAGVAVEALERVQTPKGEYLRAVVKKAGRGAAEVIGTELPKELAGLYWAKTMYWISPNGPRPSAGDPTRAGKPERFVRPVRWMLALLDEQVLPVEFAGKRSGTVTYGHRVLHGDEPVTVSSPGEYEAVLERVYVQADAATRKHGIRKALDRACRAMPGAAEAGARWREDHELVETVTELTEWPTVLAGSFSEDFLALPEEVLVTVMRDHQKYFAVETKDGKLLPGFLTVLNIAVDERGTAVIRHGNERVLRARFNDARFFWEFDERMPLRERQALLERVVFQKDLGTYAAKTERVSRVAAQMASVANARGATVDAAVVEQAVRLAKTDLTTELVKEFTELQGIVGGLYARAQGMDGRVATAIYDQYRPEGMEDRVPGSPEGAVLAMADKVDTIAGMFALGMEPTGSKDPFALRRAANGVVQILAGTALPLTLRDVAEAAAPEDEALVGRVLSFLKERLRFYLAEARKHTYDVVAAVLAAGADDVQDAAARAEALAAVRTESEFAAVSAAFKRMSNILEQARAQGMSQPASVNEALLLEPEETALWERASAVAAEVEAMRGRREYGEALRLTATLRPEVDAFFDAVMVMVPEVEVRGNRLALLQGVREGLGRIADFSEIVVAG